MQQRHHAYLICLAGALFFYYVFFQMAMFNSLSHDLLGAFNLQATQLGNLSGAYFLTDALALIPAGLLLDRLSTRHLMLAVMAACVVSTIIFAKTSSFSVALLCHAIAGIGNAFAFLGSMQLASRWLPRTHLALGMGLIITIGMIAGVVAQTPFITLIQTFGWREAVMINAYLGIAIWIFMLFTLKNKPANAPDTQPTAIFKPLLKLMKKRQNWICGLYTTLMYLPIVILGELWGVMYLTQARGFEASHATDITSMIFLGMMLGSPGLGWFSDRISRRKFPMIITALILLFLMLIIMYEPHLSMISLMVLFFLLGFFACGQVISYPTVAESNPPHLTSSALSIVAITLNIGSAITQPLFGWIMHWQYPGTQHITQYQASDYANAMLILPLVLGLAILLALKVRETYCRTLTTNTNVNTDPQEEFSA